MREWTENLGDSERWGRAKTVAVSNTSNDVRVDVELEDDSEWSR